MVFKFRDVRNNLPTKGFAVDDRHHKYLYFLYKGKRTGLYTYTSHGKPAEDVGHGNVKSMKHQLGLQTNKQVHDLVECSMTEEQYIAVLKANQKLPRDP